MWSTKQSWNKLLFLYFIVSIYIFWITIDLILLSNLIINARRRSEYITAFIRVEKDFIANFIVVPDFSILINLKM